MEEAEIWSCTSDTCKGWMRDNFSFDRVPTCPLCSSPMTRATRVVPAIVESGFFGKAPKTNGDA